MLSAEKTKSQKDGGKQTVTLGRNKMAVPGKYQYMMICWMNGQAQKETKYTFLREATKDFITYVGRNKAWEAVQKANEDD